MHIEVPKKRLHNLKEFVAHYLMIVLSILTALGMEACIERAHHQHAAADATVKIEAEIRWNLVQIAQCRDHNYARMQALQKIRDRLIRDLKAHASTAVINQHIREEAPDGIELNWHWPVMRSEAWEVAVANQSAGWIDADRVRRYSSIYAAQSSSTALVTESATTVLSGQRMADILVDMQMDDYRPRELLRVLNQMVGVASEAAHGLDGLANRIDAALSGMPEVSPRSSASR